MSGSVRPNSEPVPSTETAPTRSRARAAAETNRTVTLTERATHWKKLPLVASERQARTVMGAMTLLIGMSVLALVPAHRFGSVESVESVVVIVVSLATIPIAIAWWTARAWPSNALVIAYVVFADASVIFVAFAFESHFVALPVTALLCIIAVFAAVGGSARLLTVHLIVSLCTLVGVAILAGMEGADPWLVASRTVMMAIIFAVPIVLQSYIRRLRGRAIEALLDSLTGLWNRRGLFEVVDDRDAGDSANGAESVLGVTVIHIDGFELLNEQFGHDSGDDVLCEVARRLLRTAPAGSVVARVGGDEFVCVHRGPLASVVEAGERVADALQEPFTGPPFSISVGSATDPIAADQTAGIEVRRLMGLADVEMYRTKRRATADTRFHVSADDPPAPGLRAIRDRVKALIDSGGPSIVFQPVVTAASGVTVGYEALSRFPHGSGSPLMWFRDATVAGVASELELAAIDNALFAMRSLPGDAFVSLNTSAETIRTADLLARLTPYLGSRLLYLELTEHQRVDDFRAISYVVEELRGAGVRLAIDDVGAGFASLLPVLELRPDVLKTDNSLTQGIDTDYMRRAAAAAIVTFAHQIGAVMLMEGIETIDEQRVAVAIGADLAQGFFHGRPSTAEAFAPA